MLEKARDAGAHVLSGAVLDPSALRELIPDFLQKGAPLAAEVRRDRVYFFTQKSSLPFPIIPPPLRNHGNYIISLNAFVRWLAAQVEAEGIDMFTGFAGQDVLTEGDRVVGVRTGDRGLGKHGERKPPFEPGVDIRAKVTILCDGVRGNLTKELLRRFQLGRGRQPEQFALGIKELWEVPRDRIERRHSDSFDGVSAPPRRVRRRVHLRDARRTRFPSDSSWGSTTRIRCSIRTSRSTGSRSIRSWRSCSMAARWSGTARRRSQKVAGTRFRGLHMDGALIAGDAGGFLNSMRLKGIHLAMRTGMLAAEAAFECGAVG